MRNRNGTSRAIALVGLLTAMLIAGGLAIPQIAGAATPNPAGPPGNNGTIKVDSQPFDDAPDNQPHVGCVFQVDFYGFDKGDLFAFVTFTAHKPTDPAGVQTVLLKDKVFVGEDDASGGGSEAGLDASRTYTLDLSSISPQPKQGVHVKLTIHTPAGSIGADPKHKVFWVKGCESSSTTTTTTTSGGGGGGTTTTTTLGGGGGGGGKSVTSTGGGALPFTGSNAVPIAIAGLLLLVVGAGGLLASRRMGTR
jgi:hypothetical protein